MVDALLNHPRRAVAAVCPLAAPALRHAGWFAVLLILAPIIGPRGYGVFMLALGCIAIAEALLAGPMTRALVGRPENDPRHWSTALVTMIVGGALFWLAARAATPLLDTLVDEPSFADMFQSLAILPLLGGLAVVPTASLQRDGRDTTLFAAQIAGFAAGAGIALGLAWTGAGAWSLVAQIIVQRLVECALLWVSPGERIGLAWSALHLTELVQAMDGRAFAGFWVMVSRYAPILVVGLMLGPTAAGLYMLAARLAEALIEITLAGAADVTQRAILQRASRVLLPTVLASGLLPIALPPLIDLRWWGAILPAQVLVSGAIPAAIIFLRARTDGRAGMNYWSAGQALGSVIVAALTAPYGLTALAIAQVGWLAFVALAALPTVRRKFAADWQGALLRATRSCEGAALAGALLFFLATPIGITLAPITALSLLSAAAWLIYVVVRGDAGGTKAHSRITSPTGSPIG